MNPGGLPRRADTARSSEVDWDLVLANAPTPLRRAGPPGGLDEMPTSSADIATTSAQQNHERAMRNQAETAQSGARGAINRPACDPAPFEMGQPNIRA